MEGVVANLYFALCVILATSNPMVNAFPMTPHHELVLFQKSSTINTITEAITDAVKKAITDAKQNTKADLKAALTGLLRKKINSFNTKGEINFDDCRNIIEFNANPSSRVDLFRFLPLNSQVPLPSISLKRVVYTFNTSELIVITRGYSSQAIIPDVLRLQNIAFSFKVGLRNINTLVVIFKGDFVLGGKTIPVKVIYTHASRDISITAAVSRLTINFQSVVKQLVGLNLPSTLRRSISVPRFVISGKVTSSGGSELIVSSTEGNIHVYIIYQKTDKSRRAIAVEMSKIKLASVLNDVVGLDISGIPYFGTTVLPTIALTYAKHNINGLPNDVFAKSPLLSTTGSSIKRDLTAVIKFTFSKNLNIMMHYSGGGILTFSPVTPRSLDVQSFISAIPNFNLRRIPLPLGIKFSGILKLRINTFTINSKIKTVEIVTSYPGALTVFDGLLSIHNLMVKIKGPTGGIKVDVDGDLSISGHGFDVSIKRDQRSGVYILRAKAKKLPITSLISQFKSEVLPSELNSLLRSLPFFKFSINNPSLSFPLISSPLQIQLGGTPVISGYKTVHMASVIIRKGGKTLLVQGFQLGSFNLASFLKSITGFNFNRIAILSQDLEAAILISPVTLPNVHLTGKLSRFSVTKGLSVQANMKFPPRCSSDAFCAVALSLLGADTRLNLQGSIASANSFKLFAGVSNIKLGRGIVMSKAGFEIQGGTINSIGIVGAVDLSNPDIILAARVFLSTSGVVLEMTMSGCWKNAFGAGWLDICSLQSSVAMIPGVTLTGLALGGKVHIGYKTCSRGTRLVATGFVGIDVITPTNNYYYANLKRSTTIATILRAFCIRINVPAPLAQSGFPRGFISSFSVAGVDLPHVPLSIPQGYRFKGTLNILGLVASADVTIGLPNGIDFAVALPPINVRGLLRMSISGSDKSRGPFMKAVIRLLPTRYVNIEARGYLSVLGISRQTTLAITNTQYVFNIQGKMLHLFDAKLRIAASYGNIQRARFQVQGSFTNNLYNTLENRIKSSLKSAGQKASSRFEAARRKLDRVRGTLNNAESALRAGQKRVNDAHNAFYAAIAKVRRLRNRVNSVCRTRSCGSIRVCIKCPKGTTCCHRVWGRCVCIRPKFGDCCKHVPDAACHAANVACNGLKAPIRASLRAAEAIVNTARRTLHAAKHALIPLQAAVRVARTAVRGAQHALVGVQKSFAVGLKAANAVARFGVNGLISIREISFRTNLDVAARGSFSGSVRAVFAGAAEKTISLNINLHDITSIAKQLANHIGNGLSSLF